MKEQVESLGAKFLDLGVVGEQTEGGYAKELTPEQQAPAAAGAERADPELRRRRSRPRSIPGRPAPRLITAEAVEGMKPGSVIVDLAAETGGNCELTEPGEIVERDGVTIVGLTEPAVARWRTTRASCTRATSTRCSA